MTHLPATFSALADETRLSIVEKLLAKGTCTAGELGEVAPISAPAISRHLKVLREAGLVEQRIKGPQRIYSVNPKAMREIADWTLSHRAFWEGSLDRLETALASLEDSDGNA